MTRFSHHRPIDESEMEDTLTQISLSAARARHAAKNLTYDETASLDVTKHIKIISVVIPLPLGRTSCMGFFFASKIDFFTHGPFFNIIV